MRCIGGGSGLRFLVSNERGLPFYSSIVLYLPVNCIKKSLADLKCTATQGELDCQLLGAGRRSCRKQTSS